jgi:protocatechuate 3,4-dioxygenase beta subunit
VARADRAEAYTAGELVTPGQSEVHIVLPGLRTLVLEVLDPDGAPVAGARLLGRSIPDDDVDDMPDFIFQPRRLDDQVEVDEAARYVVSDLDSGIWDIMIAAPGFGTVREAYDLTWDDLEGSVTLERGVQVPVRVLTVGQAEPVEHALVGIYSSEHAERPLTTARTDADGLALLNDVVEGTYRVEAAFPGLAITKIEAVVPTEEPILVELSIGGTVSGEVVDAGAPPTEALMVTLTAEGDKPMGDEIPRMTLTSWWEPFAMTALAEADVFVTAGQETEALLVVGSTYEGIETGFVEGRLIVNGHPGADWKVRTWGQIRRSVTTGPDGRFNMGRLAVGDVTLMFSPASAGSMMTGGSVDTYTVKLEEGNREFVDMSITTGEVRGRVINDRDGRPVEGAVVTLGGTGEQGNYWGGRRSATATRNDGSFEFTPVAEGEYVIGAEAEGLAQVKTDPFHVAGMRATDGVLVRLVPAIVFGGTLTFDGLDGTPNWMWITAEEESGTEAATRPDSDTMTFTFDDLSPGTWTFTLHSDLGIELEPITVRIDHDTDDALLAFRPQPPEEEEPALTDDEVKNLEELGYTGGGR